MDIMYVATVIGTNQDSVVLVIHHINAIYPINGWYCYFIAGEKKYWFRIKNPQYPMLYGFVLYKL